MPRVYIDENDEPGAGRIQFTNPNKKNSFIHHWTLKSKILLAVVIILAFILALNYSPEQTTRTVGSELPTLITGFKIDLYPASSDKTKSDGYNHVMFPYSVLAHVDDNSCDSIFNEISQETDVFVVKVFEDGNNAYWSSKNEIAPAFDTIDPYVTYKISVHKEVTLDLSKWG